MAVRKFLICFRRSKWVKSLIYLIAVPDKEKAGIGFFKFDKETSAIIYLNAE